MVYGLSDYAVGKIAIVCTSDEECFEFFALCDRYRIEHVQAYYSGHALPKANRGLSEYKGGIAYAIYRGDPAWCHIGWFGNEEGMIEVPVWDILDSDGRMEFNKELFLEMLGGSV